MKNRRTVCLLAAGAVSITLSALPVSAENTGIFGVSGASGKAGDIVEVSVTMESNPGIIAAALNVHYDQEKLELISVENTDMFPESIFSPDYSAYPYYACWTDALALEDCTQNGVLMTMQFRILEDCDAGTTEIYLTYKPGNVFNWEMEQQTFTTLNGIVTITEPPADPPAVQEPSSSQKNPDVQEPSAEESETPQDKDRSDRTNTSANGESSINEKRENDTPEKENAEESLYSKFEDIESYGWYRRYVEYMLNNGYMNGVSEKRFDLYGVLSRAQLVTIVYRMAGEPSVEELRNPFVDVAENTWYSNAVIWAAANGIVKGVSADHFAPDTAITREQLMVILYRWEHEEKDRNPNLLRFTDRMAISDYARDAMNWAVGKGLVIYSSETELAPGGAATRLQTVFALACNALDETMISVPTIPVWNG